MTVFGAGREIWNRDAQTVWISHSGRSWNSCGMKIPDSTEFYVRDLWERHSFRTGVPISVDSWWMLPASELTLAASATTVIAVPVLNGSPLNDLSPTRDSSFKTNRNRCGQRRITWCACVPLVTPCSANIGSLVLVKRFPQSDRCPPTERRTYVGEPLRRLAPHTAGEARVKNSQTGLPCVDAKHLPPRTV